MLIGYSTLVIVVFELHADICGGNISFAVDTLQPQPNWITDRPFREMAVRGCPGQTILAVLSGENIAYLVLSILIITSDLKGLFW